MSIFDAADIVWSELKDRRDERGPSKMLEKYRSSMEYADLLRNKDQDIAADMVEYRANFDAFQHADNATRFVASKWRFWVFLTSLVLLLVTLLAIIIVSVVDVVSRVKANDSDISLLAILYGIAVAFIGVASVAGVLISRQASQGPAIEEIRSWAAGQPPPHALPPNRKPKKAHRQKPSTKSRK